MELEADNRESGRSVAHVGPRSLMVRLLIAAVAVPVVFCLGVSAASCFAGAKPNPELVASRPVMLLFLCPVYVTIAVASYAWQSRGMFITASFFVAAFAPAVQRNLRMRGGGYSVDSYAADVAFVGFAIAAACCTMVATINHFRAGGDTGNGNPQQCDSRN